MTPSSIADAVWTYSTRTLDESSPGASNGSFLDDIGYHVWTYLTRTVEGQTMITATLDGDTIDTNGASVQISGGGGAWLEVPNDSVFGGAEVFVQASTANTAEKFSPLGYVASVTSPGWIKLDLPNGSYVRALLRRAGASTNITANIVDQS